MRQRNGSPIDLSAQVTKVREKTRPWKSIIALILALCATLVYVVFERFVIRSRYLDAPNTAL